MKVAEFIRELGKLNYNEDTEICFGLYDYDGGWYRFEVGEIEKDYINMVSVELEPNEEHDRSIIQDANIQLEEDLRNLIRKYC